MLNNLKTLALVTLLICVSGCGTVNTACPQPLTGYGDALVGILDYAVEKDNQDVIQFLMDYDKQQCDLATAHGYSLLKCKGN